MSKRPAEEKLQPIWPQKDTRRNVRGAVIATVGLSAAVLMVLFVVYAFWGVRAIRQTLINEARRDGIAMLESMLLAAQYSVTTSSLMEQLDRENLATRARLAAAHLASGAMNNDNLPELADISEADGVTIWRNGQASVSYPEELLPWVEAEPSVRDFTWEANNLATVQFELVDTVTADKWLGAGIATEWGGLAIWQWIPGIEDRPAWSGIGVLIQQIGKRSEINYIMLQSPDGIVFASRPLPPILRLADDAFLVAALDDTIAVSRELEFEGVTVLEVVKPFLSVDLPSGMFRVGLSLAGVEAAQKRLILQLGLSAVLFLLLAMAALAYVVARRSYRSLHRSYQRVETLAQRILDSMDQAVIASDAEGRLTVYNRAAEELLGGALSAAPEQAIDVILKEGDYNLREIAEGGDAIHGREYPLKRGDGVRQLVFSTTPVITADGRREGAVSVLRDETEAREMAERMQRTSRLTEMGNLAAGVAHEIRNPLNAIAIAAQRLRMEMTDPAAAKIADTVLDESRRLNSIVEDFLSLARPSAQPSVTLDFSQVVESVASIAALDAGQRGIVWEANIAPRITVDGIADELRKAVWNIVSNAIAATPSGGRVLIRLEKNESRARLIVDDSGSGIDPANLSRIFQPYFTTKDHGTGLGLAITHRIVTDHNGTISVHSPPPGADIGTRVVIELPCARNSG